MELEITYEVVNWFSIGIEPIGSSREIVNARFKMQA
jgi:hypothetical protein